MAADPMHGITLSVFHRADATNEAFGLSPAAVASIFQTKMVPRLLGALPDQLFLEVPDHLILWHPGTAKRHLQTKKRCKSINLFAYLLCPYTHIL
jgi:hypothetical protein